MEHKTRYRFKRKLHECSSIEDLCVAEPALLWVQPQTKQKIPGKQPRGYRPWVLSRLFRDLSLNYGRHRPPDSKRIRNVCTPAGLSRCKETTPVQWDGPSLLWVVLLCESVKTVVSWNGNK